MQKWKCNIPDREIRISGNQETISSWLKEKKIMGVYSDFLYKDIITMKND